MALPMLFVSLKKTKKILTSLYLFLQKKGVSYAQPVSLAAHTASAAFYVSFGRLILCAASILSEAKLRILLFSNRRFE